MNILRLFFDNVVYFFRKPHLYTVEFFTLVGFVKNEASITKDGWTFYAGAFMLSNYLDKLGASTYLIKHPNIAVAYNDYVTTMHLQKRHLFIDKAKAVTVNNIPEDAVSRKIILDSLINIERHAPSDLRKEIERRVNAMCAIVNIEREEPEVFNQKPILNKLLLGVFLLISLLLLLSSVFLAGYPTMVEPF